MKHTFIKIVIVLTAFQSFANTKQANPDEFQLLYSCNLEKPIPDASLQLKLFEGGFAGIPKIDITQFSFGHSRVDSYMVKKQEQDSHVLGAQQVYFGEGIIFSINLTTAPRPDHKRNASLILEEAGQTQTYALLCQVL